MQRIVQIKCSMKNACGQSHNHSVSGTIACYQLNYAFFIEHSSGHANRAVSLTADNCYQRVCHV